MAALVNETEAKLASDITSLWAAHQTTTATAKRTKEALEDLRLDLGWKLSEVKSLLVRTGRSGGWSAYLRSHNLPRATVERYIRRFEALANSEKNRLSDTISEPSEDDVRRLVRRLLPRLRKVLTTPGSVSLFVDEVVRQLQTTTVVPAPGRLKQAKSRWALPAVRVSSRCQQLHEPCENLAATFVEQHPPTNYGAHSHPHSWTGRPQSMLARKRWPPLPPKEEPAVPT
jgi:hypothetical protein